MPTYKKIICSYCKKEFERELRQLHKKRKKTYCSVECFCKNKTKKQKIQCKNCNDFFIKGMSQIKKTLNHFCSRSCSATWNNKHKTHGTRRSKLEAWIEKQLTNLYPDLNIDYNQTNAINAELDIYIPSLKLAFELNGIFHYEPIFGEHKLNQTQNNDQRKFQACLEKQIELCVIDSSQQKYFKPKNSQKYLDIILKIIQQKQ